MVKYKNNDSDLLCDVIRKMDAIQCGLWDYHDGKSSESTRNTASPSSLLNQIILQKYPNFMNFILSTTGIFVDEELVIAVIAILRNIIFLEKTQDRMYEAGIRHPSVQQLRLRTRSPARSPSHSGLQARRRINSQPDSIIDLT